MPLRNAVAAAAGLLCCAVAALASGSSADPTSRQIASAFAGVAPEQLQDLGTPHIPCERHFRVKDAEGEVGVVRVIVNEEHGRVSGVYYSTPADMENMVAATAEQAAVVAKLLARRLCPELRSEFAFESADLVPDEDRPRLWIFGWRERKGEAFTGKTLTVHVCADASGPRGGRLALPPKGVPSQPKVPQASATKTAGQFWLSAFRKPVTVVGADLYLADPRGRIRGPVWLVHVKQEDGRQDACLIDAVTGNVLAPRPPRE